MKLSLGTVSFLSGLNCISSLLEALSGENISLQELSIFLQLNSCWIYLILKGDANIHTCCLRSLLLLHEMRSFCDAHSVLDCRSDRFSNQLVVDLWFEPFWWFLVSLFYVFKGRLSWGGLFYTSGATPNSSSTICGSDSFFFGYRCCCCFECHVFISIRWCAQEGRYSLWMLME